MLLFRERPASDVDDQAGHSPEEEAQKPWRVLLHNDDVTPMEYVVTILQGVFGLGGARATWVMLKAHVSGLAVVGEYPRDEAQRRVDAAHGRARRDSWPLHLSCEPTP